MRLLLDTHIFLWLISGDPLMPTQARTEISNPNNEVYLSVVSIWEAIIKYQLGKLPLPSPPGSYLPAQRRLHQIASLPVDELSVAELANLPPLHRDPFDRLLICQTKQHGLALITVDFEILRYPDIQTL